MTQAYASTLLPKKHTNLNPYRDKFYINFHLEYELNFENFVETRQVNFSFLKLW